jgi:hypothetical protein
VQAIEAGRVGRRGEFKPLVEELRKRPLAGFDMVENSDFHAFLPSSWRDCRAHAST